MMAAALPRSHPESQNAGALQAGPGPHRPGGGHVTRRLLALTFVLTGSTVFAADPPTSSERQAYRDPSLPIEARIDSLLSSMTLEEKIAILGRKIEVPRLGIRGTGIAEALSGVLLGSL